MATHAQRAEMAHLMDYLVAHEPQVHYPRSDIRVMKASSIKSHEQFFNAVFTGKLNVDCSQITEILAVVCGLKWPKSCVDGYTGTMLAAHEMMHYHDPTAAYIGALVVFGPGTGHHVCQVRHPGKNPTLFSHGQERGPMFISLSEEAKYQPSPYVFLSIAKL